MWILTVIDLESPKLVYPAATEIWKKIWSLDLDITDDVILTDALNKAGFENDKVQNLIGRTSEPEIKNKLKGIYSAIPLVQTRLEID